MTHPTFISRKSILPDESGWVIDVVRSGHPAVQLVGLFNTKRHANAWISSRSEVWPINGDYPMANTVAAN
jgi:hypothetical protein